MIGIYMYENKINGKKYIGQSTNIQRRKNEHKKWPSPHSRFDKELAIIGEENFNFIILEECSVDQLDEREKYWINYYNTIVEGYNLTAGGQSYRGESNPGSKLKEEEVKQIIILLEEHKLNNFEIAKLFNVSYGTIDAINRCQSWTHLHNYKSNIRNQNLDHSVFEGENNARAVITEEQAKIIIDLIINTNESLVSIARQFNVKDSLIYDINRCRTWTYLHNYKNNIRKESKLEK